MTLEQRLAHAGKARHQADKDREKASRALHRAVIAADRKGWAKTRIAAVAGISRQTVHDILKENSR